MLEGQAEVAAHGPGEEPQVLDPQGIVKAEQRTELPHVLLASFERQEQAGRIPREVEEPEDDDGDPEQNEEALQEPPGEIAEHHVPAAATASPRFERRLRRRNPVMGGGHGRGPSRRLPLNEEARQQPSRDVGERYLPAAPATSPVFRPPPGQKLISVSRMDSSPRGVHLSRLLTP